MDEQPDVIVVGAGPVGQSAALLLARWGVPSLVLDAREARDEIGSRAIVQQRDVIDVWDAVGVGRQIAAEGITRRTARTYYRDRELFAVDYRLQQFPGSSFRGLALTDRDQHLDRQSVDPPIPFLPMPGTHLTRSPRRRLAIRHLFCRTNPDTTPKRPWPDGSHFDGHESVSRTPHPILTNPSSIHLLHEARRPRVMRPPAAPLTPFGGCDDEHS